MVIMVGEFIKDRHAGALKWWEFQAFLGHDSVSTTEIYTHVSNSDLENVAKGLQI